MIQVPGTMIVWRNMGTGLSRLHWTGAGVIAKCLPLRPGPLMSVVQGRSEIGSGLLDFCFW